MFLLVKSFVLNGWPEEKRDLPDQAKLYWDYCDELTVEDNILLKGNHIIIPQSKQRSMFTQTQYQSPRHWKKALMQITELISNTLWRRNCKEPMIGHDIHRSWQKVGSDLLEFDSEPYIVLVDNYSNFIEVDKLQNIESTTIIHTCKQHFARYSIPEVMIPDNGPAYASAKFTSFSWSYGFKHITSSPRYPQSNGKAEKAVQVIKSLFKNAKAQTDKIHTLCS